MLKTTEENEREIHYTMQDKILWNMECRNSTQHALETQWTNVLGKKHGNKFLVYDELKMDDEMRDEIAINHNTEDAIMEMRLCAVSNVSMKITKWKDIGN